MPKWKNQFENNGRKKAGHGSKEKVTYSGVYDKSGRLTIEPTGKINAYEEIQTHRDSVDIHSIMRRYANGEVDVLSRVQGFYGDVSGLPTDYAAVLNAVARGQALFESLSVDVRAKFGHNFDQFMTALCDGSIVKLLGGSSPADPAPSPVIPDFSPAQKGDE